jgi:diguanylate cyclase (GGDEF) domain/hemerythrin-like metal-binding domain
MAIIRRERGLAIYSAGFIAGAAGFALLSLQLSGCVAGFIMANMLIVLFHACLAWGVRMMRKRRGAWAKRFWAYLAIWFAQNLFFTFIHNSYTCRAINISILIIIFSAEFIAGLHKDREPGARQIRRAAYAIAMLYSCAYIVRIALILALNSPSTMLLDGNAVTTYTMFFEMVFVILWAGILLILDTSHLVAYLKDAKSALEKMATTDCLTGLFNRHQLELDLETEQERAKRYQETVSMIMYDIDYFKQINDTHGHDEGDRVLVEIGRVARSQLRATDRLYRWGGEEFIILCPCTPLEGAATLAEKIRQSMEANEFLKIDRVTASFGVAELRHGESSDYWIKRLDRALYRAKNAGRNRVVCWDRTEPYPPIILKMEWRKDDDSGDQKLDMQHRRLMELGSDLLDTLMQSGHEERCKRIADELVELMKLHFGDEERALGAAGYPSLTEHTRVHDEIRHEIGEQQKQFHENRVSEIVFCNLLLQRVLAEHLMNADKSHRAWLNAHGAGKHAESI